jgi:hypothetical protein
MQSPLNSEERYIVAYYRSAHVGNAWWSWLVIRCSAAGLFAYGIYLTDQAVLFAAFGTLLLLDLYSQFRQPHFTRGTRSAFEKLEGRIEQLEQQSAAK